MTKLRAAYRCETCGSSSPKWLGRCPSCQEWNTLVEEAERSAGTSLRANARTGGAGVPKMLCDIDIREARARSCGIDELDRVLGGGFVPGSVTLLGGEPGIGKSTLLIQALASMACSGARVLLVTAEESLQQVRLRADRLGLSSSSLHLAAETNLHDVVAQIDSISPDAVVIDSIQTIFDPYLGSAPGSVGQVRECAHRLVREAKEDAMAMILVGHVTKEGSLAGPRVLEHLVDTVLSFEGDRHHGLRVLRAIKHRFGSTREVGLFEMTEAGLLGVVDPSEMFLADRRQGIEGSVIFPAMEGNRALLVELQTLVSASMLSQPRRCALGLDPGRLAMVLAVLERRAGMGMGGLDVHASVVGGVRIIEPATDLAIALALASSLTGIPNADDIVAFGEIGLGGEIRQVSHPERRMSEAQRLGFRRVVVPASSPPGPKGMEVLLAKTLQEAIEIASLNRSFAV